MQHKKDDDFPSNEVAMRRIAITVLTAAIIGMGAYVFNRGNSTDAAVSTVTTKVAVLETITQNMKEDITEIKLLTREIRNEIIRQKRESK